eukprot:s739_g28.t1
MAFICAEKLHEDAMPLRFAWFKVSVFVVMIHHCQERIHQEDGLHSALDGVQERHCETGGLSDLRERCQDISVALDIEIG